MPRKLTAQSDPAAYANRPDGPNDDPYRQLRKHLAGLAIPPRPQPEQRA